MKKYDYSKHKISTVILFVVVLIVAGYYLYGSVESIIQRHNCEAAGNIWSDDPSTGTGLNSLAERELRDRYKGYPYESYTFGFCIIVK